MCKHVAAVLYGVGARLDQSPELLFQLRAVDQQDLLARLDDALPAATRPGEAPVLAGDDLSALFGLDMAGQAEAALPMSPVPQAVAKPPRAITTAIPSASLRGRASARSRSS